MTDIPSFGIMTPPMQVGYQDILRVWSEADTIPEIEHAWLFDHLMPIAGDPDGPVHEGWTLLSALAAQTRRLRVGPPPSCHVHPFLTGTAFRIVTGTVFRLTIMTGGAGVERTTAPCRTPPHRASGS